MLRNHSWWVSGIESALATWKASAVPAVFRGKPLAIILGEPHPEVFKSLCSGISPGNAWGTIYTTWESIQDSHLQDNNLTYYINSLYPFLILYPSITSLNAMSRYYLALLLILFGRTIPCSVLDLLPSGVHREHTKAVDILTLSLYYISTMYIFWTF